MTGAVPRIPRAGQLLAAAVAIVSVPLASVAQEQTPVFKSGTQVVEIDVRVFDASGKFVTGLSINEFSLVENNVPQTIQAVYLVSSGTVESSSVASDNRQLPARQTWLFLFDTPHLTAAGLTRTRDAVKAFVADRFRDSDFAGVIADGRMVNDRISSSKSEIDAALESVKKPGDLTSRRNELRTWPRLVDDAEARRIVDNDQYAIDIAVRRACADEPESCRADSPELFVREKAARVTQAAQAASKQTVDTLVALCTGLARIPGPKTVVMLSEGFIFEGMESQLAHAVGQAARAGARFYPIDARGLSRGGTDNFDRAVSDDPAVGPRFDAQADGTNSLGVDTGGIVIRNENNFRRALADIERDSSTYYVVAYTPTDTTLDGKYRVVSVQVHQPDLKVRARRGYLALPPAKMLVPARAVTEARATAPSPATPTVPEIAGMPPATALPTIAAPTPAAVPAAAAAPAIPTPPLAAAARTRVNAGALVMELSKENGRETAAPSVANEGWAAYERGDVKLAARLLRQAAARSDAHPWVHYASGLANLADGRPADAAREWEAVRAAVPQFQAVYFDLADAYLQLDDEGKAASILRTGQQRWPSDPEMHNALGVAQVRRGALDDAIDSFGKAIAAAPAESLGYFNLASAYHIRYFKSHRYNSILNKWTGNDHDREMAAANFQKYIEMGGPYVQQARDALSTLSWK